MARRGLRPGAPRLRRKTGHIRSQWYFMSDVTPAGADAHPAPNAEKPSAPRTLRQYARTPLTGGISTG